jgi:hypothetical protein
MQELLVNFLETIGDKVEGLGYIDFGLLLFAGWALVQLLTFIFSLVFSRFRDSVIAMFVVELAFSVIAFVAIFYNADMAIDFVRATLPGSLSVFGVATLGIVGGILILAQIWRSPAGRMTRFMAAAALPMGYGSAISASDWILTGLKAVGWVAG